jgi:hypothetical protein
MEETLKLERQNRVLQRLARIPRMMVHIHGRDDLSEFILHELCGKECFNLRKAAYFVDNPDFNCLRGIAGFSSDEAFQDPENIWKKPEDFSSFITQAPFNSKVRSISFNSLLNKTSEQEVLREMAHRLGFTSCAHFSWNMRHDNHGILMYEKNDPSDTIVDEHIVDGMSLLSFCPIF